MGILAFDHEKESRFLDKSCLTEIYLHSQSAAIFDITLRFILFSNETDRHQNHWTGILSHVLSAMRDTLTYYNKNFEYKRFTASRIMDFLWFYWQPVRLLPEINLLLETISDDICPQVSKLNNFLLNFLIRNLPLLRKATFDLVGDILDSNLPIPDVSFLYLETLQCLILVDTINSDETSVKQIDFDDFEQAMRNTLLAKGINLIIQDI